MSSRTPPKKRFFGTAAERSCSREVTGSLRNEAMADMWALTMRLSDAGLRRLKTKTVYPDHRSPPWLTEDAPRDRSNRLLGIALPPKTSVGVFIHHRQEILDGLYLGRWFIPMPRQIRTHPKHTPSVVRAHVSCFCH